MAPHAVKLAPAILEAGFAESGEQMVEAGRCGAAHIHGDVMKGTQRCNSG
jgi:pentose-5-phosphate-3-epimerase